MMQWYSFVLISLLNQIYFQAAIAHRFDVQWLQKRAVVAPADFTPAQRQFQQDALVAHNKLRALHCVPALKLDDTVSRSAQDYADYLASINDMKHSNNPKYGENLYAIKSTNTVTSVSGTDVTNAWYNEINNYTFTAPGFSETTGHFTQVIWKSSQSLGMGYALTADGTAGYAVGQYLEPGNWDGEYDTNVPKKC